MSDVQKNFDHDFEHFPIARIWNFKISVLLRLGLFLKFDFAFYFSSRGVSNDWKISNSHGPSSNVVRTFQKFVEDVNRLTQFVVNVVVVGVSFSKQHGDLQKKETSGKKEAEKCRRIGGWKRK